ncbi:MAG: bifunctional hydroxymethylpyrimidine kinase/phosphomethylpyrimidine kinase [Lentisphaerota bacterium]
MMKPEQETGSSTCPAVLTIGGSDSSGGAGIQADLKTFQSLRVFGASALTCLTAQNPGGVYNITAVSADMVAQQIRAVCDAFPIAAAKTGMLFSTEIIKAVAAADVRQGIPVLVVDPVMVSASGSCLLQEEAVDTLCAELLPQARLLTPNIHEAEILCGHRIGSVDEMKAAAHEIGDRFDTACVIKGGHLHGDEVIDFLYDEGEEYVFSGPRFKGVETHGAGCAFSAAIVGYLAHGDLLSDAVGKARQYVSRALQGARRVGHFHPLEFLEAGLETLK